MLSRQDYEELQRKEEKNLFKGLTPSPDPGFVKKLKKYDPSLKVEFSRKHKKFVITQPRKLVQGGGRAETFVIEPMGDPSGYRQPDNRDFNFIVKSDMHRKGQEVKDRIREGEEFARETEEKQQKKVRDTFYEITKDDKIQLMNVVQKHTNQGKAKHAHRQIEVKPKGKVFK